jgi:hypothetical protein
MGVQQFGLRSLKILSQGLSHGNGRPRPGGILYAYEAMSLSAFTSFPLQHAYASPLY